MRRNRAWIREAELAHPGAVNMLRATALTELQSADSDRVRRGLAILAVLGTADDVSVLRRVGGRGAALETEAHAAISEIEARAVAGRDPLQALQRTAVRTQVIRAAAGVLGTGTVLLASVGLLRVLLHPSRFQIPFVLRGLSVLAFGIWMLWIARRGKLPHEEG